ncbi:MAG: hypothetical protein K6A42_07140 [Treponema sp.]|nr:hypothetical protein [Treponema sp.]
MKGRNLLRIALAAFAMAFALPFFSCSNASEELAAGTISFCVDKTLAQKIFELANHTQKSSSNDLEEGEEAKFRFEVSLVGDYKDSKTAYALVGEDYSFDSFTIEFDNVPVGKTVYAKIEVYSEDETDDDSQKPTLYGKSNVIQVVAGSNPLSVTTYSYYTDVSYKIDIQFDEAPDLSTTNSNCIYAIDPSSEFAVNIEAAQSDVERYEICNDIVDKYGDGYLDKLVLTTSNSSYDDDSKTLTVEDDFSLPVSEDDPGSEAASVLFVLVCQKTAYASGEYKTKFFGMSASAVTPVKKQDNTASFSAKKLNVIDTQYALYNLNRGGFSYKYYLVDDPSEDLSGSEDYSSSGTSASTTNYKQSFCFDADGNFYTMSIYPEGGNDNYIYSSNAITGVNGYHFEFGCNGISCDLKTNKLYLLSGTTLYGTGDFIKTGTFPETPTQYNLIDDAFLDANISENFAIYDGVAYFALTGTGYRIAKADLSTATSDGVVLEEVAQIRVDDYVYPEISDMIAVDGAVYVIMRDITPGPETGISSDRWDGTSLETSSITSRGCVVKCDLKNGNRCEKLGWNGNTVTKESLKVQAKMYLARLRDTGADCKSDDYNIYNDDQGSGLFLVDGTKRAKQGNSGDDMYTFFPALSASFGANKAEMESKLSSCFASPAKFIAIKPKKLVISDDGIAFYTDALGGLAYKNVDRVVTIDLENFAIESVKATSAQFERQLSGWFSADIDNYTSNSLDSIVGGGTFYAANEIYYRSSSLDPVTYNPAANTSTRRQAIFLAIKNGD